VYVDRPATICTSIRSYKNANCSTSYVAQVRIEPFRPIARSSAPRILKRFASAGGRFDQLRQCADALTDLRYRCMTEVESYAVRIFALG
jgi:hypothetical protein